MPAIQLRVSTQPAPEDIVDNTEQAASLNPSPVGLSLQFWLESEKKAGREWRMGNVRERVEHPATTNYLDVEISREGT